MDTNMSQALKLAGGLLIALVLISALVYFFGSLAPTQIALDDIKVFEQTADFNKEFEVYNKSIMYGLDVISVINKAASHNKMYIDAYEHLDHDEFKYLKDNYLMNIRFEGGNIELEQNFTITKVMRNEMTGKLIEMEYKKGPTSTDDELNIKKLTQDSEDEIKNKLKGVVKLADDSDENDAAFDRLFDNYQNLSDDEQEISNGTELINEDEDNNIDEDIYNYIIVPSSKQLKVTVQNDDTSVVGTTTGASQWSKAIFETYVYSFKSKRFRCTDVEYSDITGRIISLTFSEI